MKTSLRQGQILDSGFEILAIQNLEELKALGIWARHQKSGAEAFHILNDDPENLFAFAFATIPEDSAGEAHILEHSVLCGSENYPLKDAFLVLAQGSLQTFLNAWTFPDKTVYPASSVNEQDYFNLMAVYGDAVFRPLLSEWTFMQEGHRLVLPSGKKEEPGQSLGITGVVYNEMKGAYSSLETYAGLWSIKAVLPDTPYALESGGDPDHIPGLTWEGLREFHRTRYSPSNCRIFLAGNISTEKQLAFLNEKFLSELSAGKAAPPIARAQRWETPQSLRIPCPAGGDQKATALLSWLCGDAVDSSETIALAALAEILLGHDGSPLTRLLVESGLGEDLSPVSGLEGELRETVFVAGLRGVDGGEKAPAVESLIMNELKRLADEGIPPEEIEAALLSMEFANREIRRSGGPFSLTWLRRSLRSWLHGAKPWESLLFVPAFSELKARAAADSRYFESLIQKYFLDNPHRALITLEPEADYLAKKEAALAEELKQKEAALTPAEKQDIREKAAGLESFQNEGDSGEALAAIPHLSRKDLSPDIEIVPREILDAGGVPVIAHGLFTNGISYGDFAFPVDVLEPADYPWLPLFSRTVVSLGLPGMNYAEVSSLLARRTGGFHAVLETGSAMEGSGCSLALPGGVFDLVSRDWLIFRLKALDEKTGPALDLALRIILEADFSDLRRLRDLVLEMKNEVDASLAPTGHSYAGSRSGRRVSRSRAVEEIWNGLGQLEFVHKMAEMDTAEISRKLVSIRDTLVQAGLLANLTASAETLPGNFKALEERFRRFGPPRSRKAASAGEEAFHALLDGPSSGSAGGPEVYASASLQIGFAAMTLSASPFKSRNHAAELVLAHQLSTGALWEDIRMKGGAYGAFAQADGLERSFGLATYRDPNPLRSLEAFPAILKQEAAKRFDKKDAESEESLVKAVIGTYARETRPRPPAEKALADFLRFLYGIEDRHRTEKLQAIIEVSAEEAASAAARLASASAISPVIITGKSDAEKAAARLGGTLKELPV